MGGGLAQLRGGGKILVHENGGRAKFLSPEHLKHFLNFDRSLKDVSYRSL